MPIFMKKVFESIKKDKIISRGFTLSLVLIVIGFVYAVLNYRFLPPYLPLFNQLPWGEQRIVQTPGIFIPIAVSLFIFLFNIVFSSLIYKNSPLLSRITAATTLVITILTLLFIIRTIQIVL